jgi:hypothetical protein
VSAKPPSSIRSCKSTAASDAAAVRPDRAGGKTDEKKQQGWANPSHRLWEIDEFPSVLNETKKTHSGDLLVIDEGSMVDVSLMQSLPTRAVQITLLF